MERTDIHKDQLEELKKLGAEQIVFDLDGIVHFLDAKAEESRGRSRNHDYAECNALYLISNKLREHQKALHRYFVAIGETV